jgi:hypothetical protein
MITATRRPIWPNNCPCQDVIADFTTASTPPAGAVPRNTSAPPITTVTKASMMKVAPMVGTSVMVGAYRPPARPASPAPHAKVRL